MVNDFGYYVKDAVEALRMPQKYIQGKSDGRTTVQGNLERPSLLFDENGTPTHIFCATGEADKSYEFKNGTSIICMKLIKEEVL